jgi:uroporphyrin-III C-methyltransferase
MSEGLQIAGKVYLVGAGPGDPELLTVRALRLLRAADAVLYDDLVPPEVLAHARPEAILENVGKRCGSKSVTQEEINARVVDLARAGLAVVRLKSGDPSLFGRSGEETGALAAADVAYEIVPGVTAASAAAAAAGIPLTDRRASSQLILLAGHRVADLAPEIPPPAPMGRTVAVYMPAGPYSELADLFRTAGWPETTPCVVVSAASTPRQCVQYATLAGFSGCERLPAPALLIVGEVAALAPKRTPRFVHEPASQGAVIAGHASAGDLIETILSLAK